MPTNRSVATLLSSAEFLALPGVYDALGALLAARAGFSAVFVSGYAVSATRLARPDVGLLTQTEMLDVARRVCGVVEVPVVVDADTGYGDATNVERTVRELGRAGAAGCFLEDQAWPKRCGHLDGKRVVPLEEFLEKLAAALGARPPGFHVTARTDARAPLGLDEAIRRARAFAEGGADAVFVEAPRSTEEMAAVRAALPPEVPLVANMVEGGKTPLRSAAECAAAGFRIVVLPIAGLLAATYALADAYAALARDGSSRAAADRMLSFDAMNAVLGVTR